MKKYRTLIKFVVIASAILFGATVVLLYFSAKRQENDRYIVIDADTVKLVQLEAPRRATPLLSSILPSARYASCSILTARPMP